MEEEREREEVLEKQRALEQRREANVNAKLVQRERVAEHQEVNASVRARKSFNPSMKKRVLNCVVFGLVQQIMLEFTLRTKEMGDKRQVTCSHLVPAFRPAAL